MSTTTPTSAAPALTIKDALARSAQWLAGKGMEAARLDAELLLADTLGVSRLDLYLAWDRPLNAQEKDLYRERLKRRSEFEPIAYILGRKEFRSLELRVTPHVLVPRPETEILVERVLEMIEEADAEGLFDERPPIIADVGTGSGAIAIALAVELPEARLIAIDICADALEVARENARAHDVEAVMEFRHGSLLDGIDETLDWVVSNPPYIPESDRASLPPDVVRHEPGGALFSGADGLDVIRALIPAAAERLRSGGALLLEIGAGQAPEVLRLLAENGFFHAGETTQDYQGIERVVSARRK